jgi:hypothetical protein
MAQAVQKEIARSVPYPASGACQTGLERWAGTTARRRPRGPQEGYAARRFGLYGRGGGATGRVAPGVSANARNLSRSGLGFGAGWFSLAVVI